MAQVIVPGNFQSRGTQLVTVPRAAMTHCGPNAYCFIQFLDSTQPCIPPANSAGWRYPPQLRPEVLSFSPIGPIQVIRIHKLK